MHLPLLAVLLATSPGRMLVAQATPTDAPPPSGSQVVAFDRAVPAEPAPAAKPARTDAPLPFDTVQKQEAPARLRLLGVQLHAGVPDGAVVSAVVRPLPWLRGSVGLAHNVLGLGVQGGLTIVPFHFGVTPTIHLAAGRFFETDVTDRLDGSFPSAFDPSLRRFGYTFYSAQVGLEFGSHRSFLFHLRGGLAWVRSGLDGVSEYYPDDDPNTAAPEGPRVSTSDVTLKAAIPTVNLGFTYYVW